MKRRLKTVGQLLNEGANMDHGDLILMERGLLFLIDEEMRQNCGHEMELTWDDEAEHYWDEHGNPWSKLAVEAHDPFAKQWWCNHAYANFTPYHDNSPLARYACRYCNEERK